MSLSTTTALCSIDPPNNGVDPAFRSVLVVDDDPAIRRLLARMLQSGGYEVTLAANGVDAMDLIRQNLPSFIITDWDMPVLNGVEFCRQIRREDLPQYVYILMLTGSYNSRLVEGLNSGADDFLTKPANRLELLARMQSGARILKLEERLRRLATRDPLTDLLNRRTFFQIVGKEWERSRRAGHPLSCVMIDVDLFKRINDTYGHPAGDAVLRAISRSIDGCRRDNDSVCRYGGEEFCALLPDTPEPGALCWAGRCREAIAETSCATGDRTIFVTASLGVAQRDEGIKTPEQLLDCADRALFAAKRQGRNCAVAFGSLR